jgi:hypothetical protein
LRTIECPADCAWLGGLAVVRDPGSTRFDKEDYRAAVARLHVHARRAQAFAGDALDQLYGDEDEPEWLDSFAAAYVHLGYRDGDCQRLIDQVLSKHAAGLPPREVAALVALQQAWASLFEVAAVQQGSGLELRDLMSGETIRVREVTASAELRRLDVILAWIISVDDHYELSGAMCRLPRVHLAVVRQSLERELRRLRKKRPGISDRELAGEAMWAPARALIQACADRAAPELRTTDGEEVAFCQTRYRSSDVTAVRARLASIEGIEEESPDRYAWIGPGERPTVLGSISLESGGDMVLETMSRERLARGRRMLELALGSLVDHEADVVRSVEEAMRDRESATKEEDSEERIPPDQEREILGEFLTEHYRRWLDEAIPALGGKSPRKAVRRKSGRARVAEMLDEAENHTLTMPGGDAVDFDALRRELGLPVRAEAWVGNLHYDASRPPDPRTWILIDDTEKQLAVERHHRDLDDHPAIPNARVHALLHVVVENQLASGEETEVWDALERLMNADLTRHEAIHAIGSVLIEEIVAMGREQRRYDRHAIARALARLSAADWASSVEH